MNETTPPGIAQIATGSPPRENGGLQAERAVSKNIPQIPNLAPKETLLLWQSKQTLEDAIKNHSTVILAAGTGTGKTRGGSQIALEALGPGARMIVTENLRRATEESAKVVAADMQVEIGKEVGVRNRYSHDFSNDTKLLFCPVQSLLVMMEDDPMLERYNLIAMDEVHKESKANELAMIRLRDIQAQRKETGKPELKLMFISATADKDKIIRHFPDAVAVDVPGKTYEVDAKYETKDIPMAELPQKAAEKVRESIASGDKGNILVFLSGKQQIEKAAKALENLPNVKVIPYYSAASKEEQDSLFSDSSERKIILATNAAQEGLTLDINIVVDTGVHKHMELDVASGRHALTEEKAPKDHLTQRRGRVGRKESPFAGQKDKYYALYTEADRDSRQDHEAAEMQRTDITQEVLVLMAQGNTDVHNFKYINKPPASHIDIALERLTKIGALQDGRLTEKGKLMALLQINPNAASMVVSAAEHGAVKQASALAAMLEAYDDALEPKNGTPSPFKNPYSDALGFIQVFQTFRNMKDIGQKKRWAKENKLNYFKLHDAGRLYDELLRTVKQHRPGLNLDAEETRLALDKSIYEGFADSLVKLSRNQEYFVEHVGTVKIGEDSALYKKKPARFVTLDLHPIMKNKTITERYANLNHVIPDEIVVQPNEAKLPVSAPTSSLPQEAATPAAPATKTEPAESVKTETPPPPKPPTIAGRIKSWFSQSLFGKFWRWFSR